MILDDEILYLRAVEPEDIDKLHKWENDTSLWIHGNTLAPYSRLAIRQYITDNLNGDIYQNKQLRLMIVLKENDIVVGTVDLYEFEPKHARAGLGILIEDTFRENGYARRTLKMMEQYAFSFLHLHQLYAHISEENKTSLELFKQAGYKTCGTLYDWLKIENKYENVVVVQLINKIEIQ